MHADYGKAPNPWVLVGRVTALSLALALGWGASGAYWQLGPALGTDQLQVDAEPVDQAPAEGDEEGADGDEPDTVAADATPGPSPTPTMEPLGAAAADPLAVVLVDSELVRGPTQFFFDLNAFVAEHGGLLATYSEVVEGATLTGAEVVELVSRRYSVGSRLLLALLELRGGWLRSPPPTSPEPPLGGTSPSLLMALAAAADDLNAAYYARRADPDTPLVVAGNRRLDVAGSNAGSFALLQWMAPRASPEQWAGLEEPSRFYFTWTSLFGEPQWFLRRPVDAASAPVVLTGLPFSSTEIWHYVAGPTSPVGTGAARAAVDFAPPPVNAVDCLISAYWVRAIAAGRVIESSDWAVVVELDGDGFEGTGWTHVYRHLAAFERVPSGREVRAGDPLGHPSCEGGASPPARVSVARKYNGEWIAADSTHSPLIMGGWLVTPGDEAGEGTMLAPGLPPRRAQKAKDPAVNGVVTLP